jgi:two-component system, NarL family, nitrate/nitrite response regulator NarL
MNPSSSRSHRTPRVRVVVCDGHPMFREEFVRVIREWPEFEVLGALDDFATLASLDCRRADVLLIDPESLGIDVADIIGWAEGGPRILCVSIDPPSEHLYGALTLGVLGYLDKACSARELCDAIAATARHESRLGSHVQAPLAKAMRLRRRGNPDRPYMSPRELDVLRRVACGESAPNIAKALGLSTATVKTHQTNIYAKLGVHDRAAAVATAMRLGLIE